MEMKGDNPERASLPPDARTPELMEAPTSAVAVLPGELLPPPDGSSTPSVSPLAASLRQLRRDKRAMASLVVIVLFLIVPLFGPIVYQHIGGTYQSALNGNIGPAQYHSPFHQEL